MSIAAIALDYAQGGALVLPLHTPETDGCSCRRGGCTHPGKHPRVMSGLHDATNDVEQVERWWSMWPTANIGVRPNEGLIVLDVDPRNGGDVQLAAMQDRLGELPPTRTARTGSGGWHLWFLHDGPTRGAVAPGLDIKSHGGYVVVPPSEHASGDRYEWTDAGPIAPAPDYLRALLTPPPVRVHSSSGTASPRVAEALLRVVREAPNGKRNDLLYWAASRAVEKGVDIGPLIDAAVENGLSFAEAAATVRSATRSPARAGGA